MRADEPGLDARVVIHCQSAGMEMRQVVTVDVVFHHDFPIGPNIVLRATLLVLDEFFDLMRSEEWFHLAEPLHDRPGVLVGMYP